MTGHPTRTDPALRWLQASPAGAPAMSPLDDRIAFVADVEGRPSLWAGPLTTPVPTPTGPDPVSTIRWAGGWLCCQVAPGGSEHTQILARAPDETTFTVIAGAHDGAAVLGRSSGRTPIIGITEAEVPAVAPTAGITHSFAVDLRTGSRTLLASGPAGFVCDVTPDGSRGLVRTGTRGAREILLADTDLGRTTPLLPMADATIADARFGPAGEIYLLSDSGREFAALHLHRRWGRVGPANEVVAARDDAELELFEVLPDGCLLLSWNTGGRSELEWLDPETGASRAMALPAGDVVNWLTSGPRCDRIGLALEGPGEPEQIWVLEGITDCDDPLVARRVAPVEPAPWPAAEAVRPALHRFTAGDGTDLAGWLYLPPSASGPVPTVLSLHGGPEAQERPTFSPLFQALVGRGIAVFAPNFRGSTGYGRSFVNADNGSHRFAAIDDVACAVRSLVAAGVTDPDRVGCMGASYGGYLTLASLVHHPQLFRVGVDVCGIANFETFFAHTEPWIAASAISKYGDPVADHALLRELSPIHQIDRVRAPLMVVHGAHDTNVPLIEAQQVVSALRSRGAAVRYVLFEDEGHHIRLARNRERYLSEVLDWCSEHLLWVDEQTA